MFNIKYPDGASLKKLLYGSLKPLSEVPIRVDDKSFLIRALSPDKNILVEIYVPSVAFETYDVTGETSLTADRDEFIKVIRRGTKRDIVTLRYEDGAEQLYVTLTNAKTGAERNYQVRVIEFGKELIQSLELELPVKFQIETDDLKKLVSDARLIGEELEITYKEGEIEVTSRSESKMFKETLALDKPLLSLESKESMVTSKYDIDLLKTVSSTFEVADIATIEFGPGLPMKIYLSSDDGSKVTFWVAPRA